MPLLFFFNLPKISLSQNVFTEQSVSVSQVWLFHKCANLRKPCLLYRLMLNMHLNSVWQQSTESISVGLKRSSWSPPVLLYLWSHETKPVFWAFLQSLNTSLQFFLLDCVMTVRGSRLKLRESSSLESLPDDYRSWTAHCVTFSIVFNKFNNVQFVCSCVALSRIISAPVLYVSLA